MGIEERDNLKILGIIFDKRLSFQQNIDKLSKNLLRKVGVIYRIRNI